MDIITDVLSRGQNGTILSSGSVAERLLQANFNVNSLRTNSLLRKDEWKHYDERLIQVAREELIGVADLVGLNLTYDLNNPLGVMSVEWERQSDMDGADINMSGITPGSEGRIAFDITAIPIPIVHKDFHLNIRTLMASRTRGQPLDVAQLVTASRKVMETNESLVFNGATIGGTNGTIYGYTTAPNRSTGSTTADWNTATGEQIVADVIDMITDAAANNHYGPFYLYISQASDIHLDEDFKTNSDKTIRQRIMEIPKIAAIRPTTQLGNGEVLLVHMSVDVVDLITGMMPTVVQWDSMGGMQTNFKVMSILVPRMKDDYASQSGVVHYT